MALVVVIHVPAQQAAPPRILTRHMMGGVRRAGLHLSQGLPGGSVDELQHLARIRGVGERQRPATGLRQRVAEGGEDEEEEDDDGEEERRRY